ncbi:hypothetical protein HYQ46_008201 [Verticillium longisporum]|nr:hypothetical protein HYQ46_008201 [Verticillium longisporum]
MRMRKEQEVVSRHHRPRYLSPKGKEGTVISYCFSGRPRVPPDACWSFLLVGSVAEKAKRDGGEGTPAKRLGWGRRER